uniref:RNA-directed RNA polymerase n=1 Tax=Pestalotiopsis theae chrysovirus 1 TaxID=2855487 RepID=A0A6M2VHQ1_9VIRU|nr:RdRp [Pestalotiopsis theae chrysovirus 1]
MAGRMTRLSQTQKAKLLKAQDEVVKQMSEFGTDKFRNEFTLEIMESIERFRHKRRKNLFAIVMPSGSGKTQMSKKLGLIDVDILSSPAEHELLNEMRLNCLAGKESWQPHNDAWIEMANGTLDLMTFSEGTVLLCHSEVFALSVGAEPIAGFFTDDKLFKQVYDDKLARQNRPGALLMSLDRAQFMAHSTIELSNKKSFSSFDELEHLLTVTMNLNGIPVPKPLYKTRRVWNDSYDTSVPEWVLVGDKSKFDHNELLTLRKKGMVPRSAMDYFFRSEEVPASFGYGVTPNHWCILMAQIRASISTPKHFSTKDDLGEVFPYKYSKNMTRANLTVSRLQKGMELLDEDDVYEIACHHVGKPNNFVTAVLCYWWGVGRFSKFRNLIKEMLKVSFHWWGPVMKEFHNLIRISDEFMGESVSEEERHRLMYFEQMLGKEVEETDWKAEIKDRTWQFDMPDHKSYDPNLQLWTGEQYTKDFEHALDHAYSRMGTKWDTSVKSFSEFYERRASWLTKGSTVFNELDSEMRKYTIDLINEVGDVVEKIQSRHNKKSLFEVMDAIPLLGQNFELFNATKIVTKLDENGHKKRALLPGSLMHYLVFAYVLHFVERDEQIGTVRLNAKPDDDWVYFEQKMASIPRLLFDWANFNLYHSQWEMERVIAKLDGTIQAPDDYKYFVKAIAESHYRMVIIDPEGNKHNAGRGLYSGWRGTTFENTVLNTTYVAVSVMVFERLFDHEPYIYVDGGGDDHDGGLARAEDGYKMLAIMKKMNFKSNAVKQMVAMKSEFFRNTVTETGAYASPIRALVTFINGKWEGSGNIPIKERVGAILDQIGKVKRRGVDELFCNTMAVMCLSHWCKVNQEGEWLDLPGYVIHGRLEDNGFGVPDNVGKVWQLKDKVPEPMVVGKAGPPPGSLSTRDWLSIMCREVKELNIDVDVDSEKVLDMAAASFEVYDRYDYSNVINFRTEVIGKENAVEPRVNESAWESMIDFMGLPDRAKNLQVGKLLQYQEIIPYMNVSGKPITREQLAEVLGIHIFNIDVVDFKGDVYYR